MIILSIDGGGVRGLIPAIILADIEQRSGKLVGQLVDLVAGTSTGGIIAAAVGAGIPMAEVASLYGNRAPQIFQRSLGRKVASLGGLTDEQYSDEGLARCLEDLFGARRLSDCTCDVLITSYDLVARVPHLFKSSRAKQDRRRDDLLRNVCRASAAAPTYFEPATLLEPGAAATRILVDGGVAANNPAMCAAIEALKTMRGRDEHVFPTMISLGTGRVEDAPRPDQVRHWGMLTGARQVLELLMEGPADVVDYQCRTVIPDYHRLQPVLPRPVALDATDQADMVLMATVAGRMLASPDYARLLRALGLDAD